jgi:hypothetical protein
MKTHKKKTKMNRCFLSFIHYELILEFCLFEFSFLYSDKKQISEMANICIEIINS